MQNQEDIISGKYLFRISDRILEARGQILSRNFKIGGEYPDCVNVSISYNAENVPMYAKIPHALYDPECALGHTPLDRGAGSILMIKTLLNYVHQKIPSIKEVEFEDKSSIECANETELSRVRNKKRGTNVYPVPLNYFSIAFNGQTWYEKHFNARQKNSAKHALYREQVSRFLYSEETKSQISFVQFLSIASLSGMSAEQATALIDELEPLYTRAKKYADFFQSMPTRRRCILVRGWLVNFMEHFLKDVFNNEGWVMDIPFAVESAGGGRRGTRKYYLPKSRIIRNRTSNTLGIQEDDI